MKCFKWMLFLPFFLLPHWSAAQSHGAMLPVPENLQQDAAQAQGAGKPLVLMFSLPDCPFCKVVRQHYLMPMLRDPAVAERPVIRELQITSRKSLTGFDGMLTTQAALAKRYGVRMAPTLVFVDASGEQIAAPVVGGDGHGFYIAYLDKAFEEAAKNLASGGQKK
jgi:thioredoxin-related protein